MLKRILAVLAALCMTLGVTVGGAAQAEAATIISQNFAKCNPRNVKSDIDYRVRGEQTYFRTANPNGKILRYAATPTFEIVRPGPIPNLKYVFRRVELRRPGNPTLVKTTASGQWGSTSAPAGPAATTTVFVWDYYVGGQYYETLVCSLGTYAQ